MRTRCVRVFWIWFLLNASVSFARGFCLPAEALQRLWVIRQIFGQKFERHKPAETGVLGFVDDTHASAPKLLQDAVMRDGLADHEAGPRKR
jgi:hypothetical protein